MVEGLAAARHREEGCISQGKDAPAGCGQCTGIRTAYVLVAKNRSVAAASSTSRGMEIGMAEPLVLPHRPLSRRPPERA